MKINCGPTPQQKEAARKVRLTAELTAISNWHDHFCLMPVRLGPNDCRIFETIEKRLDVTPIQIEWYVLHEHWSNGSRSYTPKWIYRAKEKK